MLPAPKHLSPIMYRGLYWHPIETETSMRQICRLILIKMKIEKMKILTLVNSVVLLLISIFGCIQNSNVEIPEANIQPRIITESVKHDTDDPAIWIHPEDISKSLII